jgi:transposase
MFWVSLARGRATSLFPIFGTMNNEAYISLLDMKVLPWLKKQRNRGMVLQQDNTPAHVSWVTKQFFLTKRLQVLDWPPNSPDLNPIENAWSVLKDKVAVRLPKSLQELEAIAAEEWGKLTKSFFENLIDSVPRRIEQVIARNGGKADY